MQRHMWYNASETKWNTHQWTLEDKDRTCKQNVMDPREAHGSACQSVKNARMQKCEMWNMWKHETHEICKCAKYELCGIAKCAQHVRCVKTREIWNAKYVRCMETRNMGKCETCNICENVKIAKVTTLQQVQYKVLRYGLYMPIETSVSTAEKSMGETLQ
jgi:hypothetical protein